MSAHPEYESDEKTIPLSVVFITIGTIILLTVMVIWIVSPATMPWALYNLATAVLPDEVAQTIPTPAAVARVPTLTPPPLEDKLILLPETPLEAELPPHFVNAADALSGQSIVGQPIRIVIPQIELDAPVSKVDLAPIESNGEIFYQWQVPNRFEAGWHNGTALLGQPGNTVLNGHHNVFGEVFRDLVDLNKGDEIILYDSKQSYTYRIIEKEIFAERGQPLSVRLENAKWIEPTDDERITLVTCWPYTDNSHRLVIVAQPVAASDKDISLQSQ